MDAVCTVQCCWYFEEGKIRSLVWNRESFLEKGAFEMGSAKEGSILGSRDRDRKDVCHCWSCQEVSGGGFVFWIFFYL